jgi:hypothetical protein
MTEEHKPTPLAYSHNDEVHFGRGITDYKQLLNDLVLLRERGGVGIAPKVALHRTYGDLKGKRNLEALFSDAKSLGFECTQSGFDIVFTPNDLPRS